MQTPDDRLVISMPEGQLELAGLVIKTTEPGPTQPPALQLPPADRPKLVHKAPASIEAESPLNVKFTIPARKEIQTVRLHYRPVNQLVSFSMWTLRPEDNSQFLQATSMHAGISCTTLRS